MARQDPWELDPVVAPPRRRADARQNEREQAETRYRNTTGDSNPLGRPPILPGEEGYVGTQGQYLPAADVIVSSDTPWANDPVAQAPVRDRSGLGGFGAFAQSATEWVPGLDEAAAGLLSVTNGIPYSEARDLQSGLAQDDRETRPLARNAGAVAGFGAGLIAPGGAYVRGAQGFGRLARGAAVGAGYGAAYGAGAGEDTFASRMQGAATGGIVGGLGGTAVEAVAPYAARLAGIAGDAGRAAFNRVPGATGRTARAAVRQGAPAEVGAAIRIADQIGPDQFARRQAARDVGVDLSVVDTLDNTGERLIRSAAGPAGPAGDLAVNNLVSRQAGLKPEVMAVTRGLSPETRTAEQLAEGIADTRSRLATEQYAPAYATPVQVTEGVLSALSDAPGRAALNRARQAAVARRDATQVAEIDGLIAGDIAEVSAGTLDRVRIALGNRAEALGRNATGARDVAGGLRGRADDINAALENVDELAPARATYRDLSGAIDAIETAPAIFSTDPAEYAATVANMTPTQREAAIVGVRQSILDMLGRQRETGTGALQTISEAPYARQNLEALLGPDEAARYLGSIRERVAQTQRAARISPNTNSQTFGRMEDDAAFNVANAIGAVADGAQALRGSPAGLARTIERIGARASLSPQEREAIVQLGLGSADELERIVALAEQARRANRPPPRAVREFVAQSRNVLGADSPVTQQIQTILLPTRVSAEEEQD